MGFLDDVRRGLGIEAPAGAGSGDDPPEAPARAQAPVPWERLPGEPDAWWLLFSAYLQSSSPSVAAFARGPAASSYAEATIQAMASRWRWHARRAALEQHLALARAQGASDAARAQGEQIAASVQRQLDQAQRAALAFELRGGLESMSAKEVIAYQKQAIELARLLRGEVTAHVRTDLSGLTQEERDAMRALAEKAIGKGSGGA